MSSRPSTLGVVQEPLPQERKASTAIHGSFERLQFIDFYFGNALAPRQTQSGMNGVIVSFDPSHETLEFRNAKACRLPHPGTQLLVFALTHHLQEGLEEGIDDLDLRREVQQLIEPRLLFLSEILPLAREQPAQRTWGDRLGTLLA